MGINITRQCRLDKALATTGLLLVQAWTPG